MITDIWTKLFLSLSTLECDNLDKDTETIWHKMINQKSHYWNCLSTCLKLFLKYPHQLLKSEECLIHMQIDSCQFYLKHTTLFE